MSNSCADVICPGSQYAMFFPDTSSGAADGKNCYCVCQGVLPQEFHTLCPTDNKTLNSETCECECISQKTCSENEKPDGECGCECDVGNGDNCIGNQVIVDPENDGNCQCGCIGDPQCPTDNKTLNSETCQCECISQENCGSNERPDGECGCECDVGNGDSCPGNQVIVDPENDGNCQCGCMGDPKCEGDAKTLNSETCQCECISQENCGSNERPDGECGCECDVGNGDSCPGNQVLVDPELDGGCVCECPNACRTWTTDTGEVIRNKRQDPTTCECKCISQDPCSENEKPDGDCGCVCDVGNGDTCPENQVLISEGETGEKWTCECGCPPGSQHCDGGQVLLQKGTAECVCGCKEPQVWDDEESRCILNNYDVQKGQTKFPIASDESYIGGTLNIKDNAGTDYYTITNIGSVHIAAPGTTRNYVESKISATPSGASTQSDPHIRTFFNEFYTL